MKQYKFESLVKDIEILNWFTDSPKKGHKIKGSNTIYDIKIAYNSKVSVLRKKLNVATPLFRVGPHCMRQVLRNHGAAHISVRTCQLVGVKGSGLTPKAL